jgi:hypothetical protein
MRIFLWAGLFVTAAAATFGLGLALLVAPEWTGTFLCTYFAVFPAPGSRRALVFYRVLGALLAPLGAIYGVEVGRSVLRVVLGKP